MLDFCGKHGITSDIDVILILKVNEAMSAYRKATCYRFVIDMEFLVFHESG